MSRSGYSDDYDNWAMIRWRGAVEASIKGHRGQAFLREMLAALDALPEKRLIAGRLELNGQVCALGAVAKARGLDTATLDVIDCCDEILGREIAEALGVAPALAREVMFTNDEAGWGAETPEARFDRMRNWIAARI